MGVRPDGVLSCSVEESVATLTINHPPANTLTVHMLDELEAAFDGLAKDDTVKAVILTGAGRFFIAGADVRVLAEIASAPEGERMALRGQTIAGNIEAFEKPVIAAINGACLGGGSNSRWPVTSGWRRRVRDWANRKSIWASCQAWEAPSACLGLSVDPGQRN